MTLTDTPDNFDSVNKELIWVASDANATNPANVGYQYVFDLYIDSILIYTAKIYPDPINSFGVCDLSAVIREYINPKLKVGTGMLSQSLAEGEAFISVQVKIREYYNGAFTAIVLTDSVRKFSNWYGDVAISNGTNTPRVIYMAINTKRYYISRFAPNTTSYNITFNATNESVTPVAGQIDLINIAPEAILVDYPSVNLTNGYQVTIAGITYTVMITCQPRYISRVVHFLNKFGGFDSMEFYHAYVKRGSITKSTYQQKASLVNNSGVVYKSLNGVQNEQLTTFGVRVKDMLELNSRILTDDEWEWLSELILSPYRLLDYNNIVKPIDLEETNYLVNQFVNNELQVLKITIPSEEYNTQFR